MLNKIQNNIKSKYYTYQPGEFMPVYSGSELLNKKQFHIYKAKRFIWSIKNYRLVVHYWTHQQG